MQDNALKQSPSSGFYGLLGKQKKFTIWAYCQHCWTRTEQEFHHEDAIREYYTCTHCGGQNAYAVR